MLREMDRVGCFGYVGWRAKNVPDRTIQLAIYGAYARASIAAGVFLGALEPNEGFGLAALVDGEMPPQDILDPLNQMRKVVAYATAILCSDNTSLPCVALGLGLLRGNWPEKGEEPCDIMGLVGPEMVERIYGELPNRCGGLAKGKDSSNVKLPVTTVGKTQPVIVFRQPWTLGCVTVADTRTEIPDSLINLEDIQGQELDSKLQAKRPYVVGLSLDFAKSQEEFRRNAYRARLVIDEVLVKFENLAKPSGGLFVSPRFGDGLAAVVVVEANTEQNLLEQKWRKDLSEFCREAAGLLRGCQKLGLRVGMAISLDFRACAPRLAGIMRTRSSAVETLAEEVIGLARQCHEFAKEKPEIITHRLACLQFQNGEVTQIEGYD